MKDINKKISTIIFISFIILIILLPNSRILIKDMIEILSSLDVEKVKEYILSFGILAPIVSFILMLFQSLAAPLPAFLITFANASLFGWFYGAILSWTSALAGASLCFFLSKKLGRNTVEKITSKMALEQVDDFFEKYGQYTILIARLLPFMSFDVISYAAGLTSIRFLPFILATAIGQLPATIIYSYIGGMLVGGTKRFVFALMIIFSISVLILLLRKIHKNK